MTQEKTIDELETAIKEELKTSPEGDDKTATGTSQSQTTDKVKVGDQEFDPDELAKLVEKGKITLDIEKKQNIDVKELYPDYTRKSQLLKDKQQLTDYMSSQFGETSTKPDLSSSDDGKEELSDEVKSEIAKARKLGFLVKEDEATIVERVVNAASSRIKAEMKLESKLDGLEKLYDGSDKAPVKIKFDKNEIIDYMVENFKGAQKLPDPEDVFKLLHLDEFKKATPTAKVESPTPPVTEKAGSTGSREPKGREVPSFSDEEKMRKYIEEEFAQPQAAV